MAGPKSRDLLNGLLDAPVDDARFPYMACGAVRIGGIGARLFRISFSGEHAYEIAVPARYGAALFAELVTQAEMMGGGPYGMEALNVLRLEKGFITHAEIHGRTTAFDIGMQRLISPDKDCIGKAAAARSGLVDKSREQLVALRPVGAVKEILAGAHLFTLGDPATSGHDQGYVTSACYSPTLGHVIGLGFLKAGRARIGERVRMVDHLRGSETLCEVLEPVQFDQSGGRLRG